MKSKILDVKWFTPGTGACIGIVLVDTGFGHKAYIGNGTGINEQIDTEVIFRTGARFHYGHRLWPEIKEWAD